MSRDRTEEIKQLFLRLSDADAAERQRWFARGSGEDPAVKSAVEVLLKNSELLPDGFLEPLPEVVEVAERARARTRELELGSTSLTRSESGSGETGTPGQKIGRYELVRLLGEGGFGAVWEAEQHEPMHRLVALKLIKRGMDTDQVIARFAAERQALALMDHPNISTVLDAGTTDADCPFFVMELVIGTPIVDYCRNRSSSRDERLRLFETVCRAIHHAHQRGIVHRDIKPSNVLVTECDGEATPKVIDFGVAKAIDTAAQPSPDVTQQRQLVGTPAYMAPEQTESGGFDIDARSDIYSLGVLLYELLTGSTPFGSGDETVVTLEATLRRVREEPPQRPSRLLSGSANLPRELDWITLRCLEKERTRRYASALELAEDIRRHRNDEPVQAGPPDLVYRVRKFCRRHRVAVASAAALFGTLLLIATAGFFWTAWKNRQLDTSNAELLQANSELLQVNAQYLREKDIAEQALEDVERLSDARVLDRLVLRAEEGLWPAVPDKIQLMEAWLEEAEELVSRADVHRGELETVRSRALPPVGEDPEALGFAETKDAWLHSLLVDLIRRLDAFAQPDHGAVASVRQRLAFARDLKRRSLDEHADAWSETIAGVLDSEMYPQLSSTGFEQQIGLVPLGKDADSDLYEFLELATHEGELPSRDADGGLVLPDRCGVVLVLIPGGRFQMGAQNEDRHAPNYDPASADDESPVHTVEIEPFFLGKHELTQGQWMRLEHGTNPSNFAFGLNVAGRPVTLRHPVDQVVWADAERVLRKAGLVLPSEAQWEYAARAGTTTPWFFGEDSDALDRFANFADRSAGSGVAMRISDSDDGHAYPAPAGSYEANPFGLHDIYGNLNEWCRDRFRPSYGSEWTIPEHRPANALRGSRRRPLRGGAWNSLPASARSANRVSIPGNTVSATIGVRPARAIRRP